MNKVYFRVAVFSLMGLIVFGASRFVAEQKGTQAEQKTSTAASDKVAADTDGRQGPAGVAYNKFDFNHDGQVAREEVNPFREFYSTLMVAAAGGTTSATAALRAQAETMKLDREDSSSPRAEEAGRRSAAEFLKTPGSRSR